MNSRKLAEFSLAHRLDVSRIAEYLTHALDCESWYVVCHQERQFVIHLTQGGADRFAVSFECTPPADKGIYHGSLASEFCLIALGGEADVPADKINEIRSELARLAHAAGVHAC
jgi:hypothetical protein